MVAENVLQDGHADLDSPILDVGLLQRRVASYVMRITLTVVVPAFQ